MRRSNLPRVLSVPTFAQSVWRTRSVLWRATRAVRAASTAQRSLDCACEQLAVSFFFFNFQRMKSLPVKHHLFPVKKGSLLATQRTGFEKGRNRLFKEKGKEREAFIRADKSWVLFFKERRSNSPLARRPRCRWPASFASRRSTFQKGQRAASDHSATGGEKKPWSKGIGKDCGRIPSHPRLERARAVPAEHFTTHRPTTHSPDRRLEADTERERDP